MTSVHEFAFSKTKPFPEEPLHTFQPEDWVLKAWNNQEPGVELTEKWTGPYDMLLTTPTLLKRAGVQLWTHHIALGRQLQTMTLGRTQNRLSG